MAPPSVEGFIRGLWSALGAHKDAFFIFGSKKGPKPACQQQKPTTQSPKSHFPFWELLRTFFKRKPLRVIVKKILREFWERHNDCE